MHNKIVKFKSSDLQERSLGLRFDLPHLGEHATGFVIRFDNKPYAYINQCAHVSVEMDWKEGEFFTPEKDLLICATHGAEYEPDTGFCVNGPCKGKRLQGLRVVEEDDEVVIHFEAVEQN
jgi:nitrite reductase/ring-hydroxylating ferredoxin subunit